MGDICHYADDLFICMFVDDASDESLRVRENSELRDLEVQSRFDAFFDRQCFRNQYYFNYVQILNVVHISVNKYICELLMNVGD